MKSQLKAAILSVAFLVIFIFVWKIATQVEKVEVDETNLSTEQVAELTNGPLAKEDIELLASKGLTFDQLKQISDIGVSLADIEAAGGVEAFGFTTGGAAEEAVETAGFPSAGLVWQESWEQL